jgi:hypothetical protein
LSRAYAAALVWVIVAGTLYAVQLVRIAIDQVG